jgi:hypothetical protein
LTHWTRDAIRARNRRSNLRGAGRLYSCGGIAGPPGWLAESSHQLAARKRQSGGEVEADPARDSSTIVGSQLGVAVVAKE